MKLLQPSPPPYDPEYWLTLPFAERLRLSCQAWAIQGYGTPLAVYALYLVKVLCYLGAWCWFCSFTPSLGAVQDIASWWLHPVALKKAVLWSMLFEVLGLGCGSGPLTGRYHPMIGGVLYFARPGTSKAPLFPGVAVIGNDRRGWLEVGLYLLLTGQILYALTASQPTAAMLWPVVGVLLLLGILDRTVFLAARAEHFLVVIVCFCFADDWLAGTKLVWLAIWWWAAFSKLNRHFPTVIGVMVSNSPVLRWPWLRKRMYRAFPDDLRPSRLAHWMGHAGTVAEVTFPLILAFAPNAQWLAAGLGAMLMFHLFITSNVPMGVPIEWNIVMVYGGFALFGAHPTVSPWSLTSLPLAAILFTTAFAIPLLGNLWPSRISFLPAMRYYAGNWAYSVWLFANGSEAKLDTHLIKSAAMTRTQLERFYDQTTIETVLGKVIAFRAMHLHGRLLRTLLPQTEMALDDCEYLDGEVLCGVVLGYNFGDGHLHDERLLHNLQRQCHFGAGELRCIFVEAQPLGRPHMHWRIVDAHEGLLKEGHADVAELAEMQPGVDQ